MRRLAVAASVVLAAAVVTGQGTPLATLSGSVTAEDGSGLGGVAVLVESPALQGARTTVTSGTGAFLLALLPPGTYTLTLSKVGLESVRSQIQVTASGTARLEAAMRPAAVKESVAVIAGSQAHALPGTLPLSVSYRQQVIDLLPLDRTLRSTTLLAPGVTDNGPKANTGSANERPALMISGAPSYDSLFLVNGVVVNENLRGQPQDLFIEDAIQETRIDAGRISAEYGNFTGGVVNVVTKSGGNRLSGSFRTTFSNDDWTANNAYDENLGIDNRVSDVNETYEGTLGGPLWRDRLWFFGAGRQAGLTDARETAPTPLPGDVNPTPIPYVHRIDERRVEGKLTGAVGPSHNVVVSYIQFHEDEEGSTFNQNILDTKPLVPVSYKSTLLGVHYGGVLSRDFFLEAQYSSRRSSIEQGGPEHSDLIAGTFILDESRGGARYHSPVGRPGTDRYDNESWFLKGSYFLSTEKVGSHELSAGIERLANLTRANIHVSGSDFDIDTPSAIVRGTEVFPVFGPGTLIDYNPILIPSRGVKIATDSAFVSDRVALGRHWSADLGLRYDRNDDRDGLGNTFSRTSSWSPRLAVVFDPSGTGTLTFDGGYARYVSKNQDSLAVGFLPGGGEGAFSAWRYQGPCINCDSSLPTSQLVSTDAALKTLFDWFASTGGTQSSPTGGAFIPGFNQKTQSGGLRSPSVKEYSVGASAALGSKGLVRIDYLYRNWKDLYSQRTDLSTGKTNPDRYGNVYDVAILENSNRPIQRYEAVQSQISYRFSSRTLVSGAYTWSRLVANFAAEKRCCVTQPSLIESYPEYTQERWNFPTGYLSPRGPAGQPAADQRHRLRAWGVFHPPLPFGEWSVSLLESLDSGRPYDAVGRVDPCPYVQNPGYATPPCGVDYFFSKPGAFRTDTITHTDLSLNWSVSAFRSAELFVDAQVINLFNEQRVVAVNRNVMTSANDPDTLKPFDPFHEAPVQNVNFRLGTNFGKPTGSASYQQPRTFRLSVGVRF